MDHDVTCEAPWPCNCAARADLPEELVPIYPGPPAFTPSYDSGRMWGAPRHRPRTTRRRVRV
jgi:hypothetical protein